MSSQYDTPPNTDPTPLDICNMALSRLGEPPLRTIDPNGSAAARLCYLHYHPTRREVLTAARWTFAIKKTVLSSAAEEQLPEDYDRKEAMFTHTLPSDCLRVLSVSCPGWILRGNKIYCRAQSVSLSYICDLEDTTLFEPLFTAALSLRLAYKLSIPLTGSTTARQALLEEYNRTALPAASYYNRVQRHSNDESHPLYELWKSSHNR